jgi:resorcinol 4-hydroxylase (FADH2)
MDDVSVLPTPEILVERARGLTAQLRKNAEACEAARQMPVENFDAYLQAGLLNVCKTKEYGGYEYGWDVLCEIAYELGRGCGASAWVYSVLAEHNQTAGTYPLQAQQDIWEENPDALVASGNSPAADIERVEGGWKITGQLNYSSGCDFADWHLTGMAIGGNPLKILVPQSECEIVDNWHVVGLSGTGSKDIKMDGVFIPDHRTIPIPERGPRFNEAAIFRIPQWSVNPFSLVAVTIGIAQGAIDHFIENMKTRSSRFGSKVAEFQSLQLRIAESSAEVDAAKKVMLSDLRETMEFLEHNEELPIEMMARNKRDMAYCPLLATRAVDRIFYAAGAGGLLLSEEIQRSFRDVHAGNKQIALNWDINGTTYGKVALGLDPAPVRW